MNRPTPPASPAPTCGVPRPLPEGAGRHYSPSLSRCPYLLARQAVTVAVQAVGVPRWCWYRPVNLFAVYVAAPGRHPTAPGSRRWSDRGGGSRRAGRGPGARRGAARTGTRASGRPDALAVTMSAQQRPRSPIPGPLLCPHPQPTVEARLCTSPHHYPAPISGPAGASASPRNTAWIRSPTSGNLYKAKFSATPSATRGVSPAPPGGRVCHPSAAPPRPSLRLLAALAARLLWPGCAPGRPSAGGGLRRGPGSLTSGRGAS